MKNKTVSILIFIICIIFFISTVSASDLNETGADDKLESIDEIDEVVGQSDDGTFQSLNTKISNAGVNSKITLENNYTYNSGFITGGIEVSKSLTIDGAGFTIDGGESAKIFKITNGAHLTLENINIVNAKSNNCGAIENNAHLTVINSTFKNNQATSWGGAIGNCGGTLTVINSTFTNNKASSSGSAIDNNNGGILT